MPPGGRRGRTFTARKPKARSIIFLAAGPGQRVGPPPPDREGPGPGREHSGFSAKRVSADRGGARGLGFFFFQKNGGVRDPGEGNDFYWGPYVAGGGRVVEPQVAGAGGQGRAGHGSGGEGESGISLRRLGSIFRRIRKTPMAGGGGCGLELGRRPDFGGPTQSAKGSRPGGGQTSKGVEFEPRSGDRPPGAPVRPPRGFWKKGTGLARPGFHRGSVGGWKRTAGRRWEEGGHFAHGGAGAAPGRRAPDDSRRAAFSQLSHRGRGARLGAPGRFSSLNLGAALVLAGGAATIFRPCWAKAGWNFLIKKKKKKTGQRGRGAGRGAV